MTKEIPDIGSVWEHVDLKKSFRVTDVIFDNGFSEYEVVAEDLTGSASIRMWLDDFMVKMTKLERVPNSSTEAIKCTCSSADLFNYGCQCGHFKLTQSSK